MYSYYRFLKAANGNHVVAQLYERTPVYFVEGSGLIKIGYANFPVNRFVAMLTGSPVPLTLLASMPGGSYMENKLHKQFAADRSHGEWFRPSDALREVIAAAPTQYGPEFRDRLALTRQDWKAARRRSAA